MLPVLKATGSPPQEIDAQEVRRALALFADPAHGVELRFAPSFRSAVRPTTDAEGLLADVHSNADARAVYFCINPVSPRLVGAAKNKDVLQRRWFFLDLDPVRLKPDSCATDVEKSLARERALYVLAWLDARGWPEPILVDSGNGMHLYYRVDLPNDDLTRALFRGMVRGLATRFDTAGVKVDPAVHNAARVAKLPGTWARKGIDEPERPWRPCRILSVPEAIRVVDPRVLSTTLAGLGGNPAPKTHRKAPKRPFGILVATSGRAEKAYGDAAIKDECDAVAHEAINGHNRNNRLNDAALSIGTILHWDHWSREDIEQRLEDAAVRCQLHLDDAGMAGVKATIRSGLEYGLAHPRADLEKQEDTKKSKAKPNPSVNGTHKPNPEKIIIYASEITPTPVEWLWPGRIALNKLTTFAGQTGQGKTFVSCDIIARLSTGRDWPDGQKNGTVGQTLFISGDDDIDDTIVPRLVEASADRSQVFFLVEPVQADWTLAALETLDKAIAQATAPVRLVVIDPPTSYLGDVDEHKNAELRSLLTPFKNWAKRQSCAVILITHVNKGGAGKVDALMRVMGSVAWVTGVRTAYIFAPDPDDATRQLFVALKNNVGPKGQGMAYRIHKTDALARVEWLGTVDTTADEAMNKQRKPRRVGASQWLEEQFREVDQIPSRALFDDAKKTTISQDALKEAKDDMGIKARQTCDADGERRWVWYWTTEARQKWRERTSET